MSAVPRSSQPPRARILVVEDDEALRGFLRELLEDEGYEIALAGDGNEALRLVAERLPDLVLTDLVMPDCEGIELVQNLRPRAPDLPIVAMSGGRRMSSTYLRVVGTLGADLTLSKPFDGTELLEAIERLLGAR